MQVVWIRTNFLLLWTHFTPFLVSRNVKMACVTIILNIRYPVFLFQDLHSHRDNVIYTMTNKSIIHHLYKEISNNDKDFFRSKYLCIAPITEMAAHQGVDFLESHDISGNIMGTNQER